MSVLKLTKEEAEKVLLIGQSTFYSWYNSEKFGVEEDTATNTKYLLVEEEEARRIYAKNLNKKKNRPSSEDSEFLQNDSENTVIDAEYSKKEQNRVSENSIKLQNLDAFEMMKFVSELSQKVGKYELLEDKSKELKGDVSHWQKQFYEINYKYEKLVESYEKLQNDYSKLLEESKKENKKAWWKIGKP